MADPRRKSLVVLTALRFTTDYGSAALRSAREKGEDVVLCLVSDRDITEAVSGQLADVGFLGEKLAHELRDAMATEYRERGERHLEELAREARELGVAAETRIVDGPFLETVIRVAREVGAVRILVPRLRRPHLSRVFFGSEVDRLVKAAPCPVEVIVARGAPGPSGAGA